MKNGCNIRLFILIGTLIPTFVIAQQVHLHNQYFINKYALSPAYSGSHKSFETFMTYRKSWVGVEGAPQTQNININGAIAKNMGVGARVIGEQTGIFRSYTIALSYAYHLPISEDQSVHFGLDAGLFGSNVDVSGNKTESATDPIVMNSGQLNGTTFNANFGLVYKFQDLNIGFVLPQLVETKIDNKDANDNVLYTLKRHYMAHASYSFNIKQIWTVEPIAVVRTTANSPFFFELSALVKYKQQVWGGLTYRKNTSIGLSIGGVVYSKVVANYTYELSGQGMLGNSGGTHEISIGFLIGTLKSLPKTAPSIFDAEPEQPYMEWLD